MENAINLLDWEPKDTKIAKNLFPQNINSFAELYEFVDSLHKNFCKTPEQESLFAKSMDLEKY